MTDFNYYDKSLWQRERIFFGIQQLIYCFFNFNFIGVNFPCKPCHCHDTYTTVTSLTMTPDLYLEVGTTSYRATCWYKNLSYSDMSLFYQKQYLSFLMISISATCCNMRGYTVIIRERYSLLSQCNVDYQSCI